MTDRRHVTGSSRPHPAPGRPHGGNPVEDAPAAAREVAPARRTGGDCENARKLASGNGSGGSARPLGRSRPERLQSRVAGQGKHGRQKGASTRARIERSRQTGQLAPSKSRQDRHREGRSRVTACICDTVIVETTMDAIKTSNQARVRRRNRPGKLQDDRGYVNKLCRIALCRSDIRDGIACKGIDCSEWIGRHRWAVEARWPGSPGICGRWSAMTVAPITSRPCSLAATPSCAARPSSAGTEKCS